MDVQERLQRGGLPRGKGVQLGGEWFITQVKGEGRMDPKSPPQRRRLISGMAHMTALLHPSRVCS